MEPGVNVHDIYFDPNQHWRETHIIGVGAIGSRLAEELARMGVSDIHLYDPDIVEMVNLRNQRYFPRDIGMKKVDALARMLHDINPEIVVHAHAEYFDTTRSLSGTVCLMLDSMQTRKEIFEASVRMNDDVSLMIDAGIDVDTGRCFAINPANPLHVEKWEKYWTPDATQPTPNVCTDVRSGGSIASVVIGFSVQQFVRWYQPNNHNDGSSKGGVGTSFDNMLWFTYGDDRGVESSGLTLVKGQW